MLNVQCPVHLPLQYNLRHHSEMRVSISLCLGHKLFKASSKLDLLKICSHINKNIIDMKTQTRVSTVQFNSPIPCYKYHDSRIAILWQFYRPIPIVLFILKSNKIRFKTIAALTYLNERKRIWLHNQPPECTVLAFKCLIC